MDPSQCCEDEEEYRREKFRRIPRSRFTSASPCRIIYESHPHSVGIEDIKDNRQLFKQVLCEFIGTFLTVFFGIGSILTALQNGEPAYWNVNARAWDSAPNGETETYFLFGVTRSSSQTLAPVVPQINVLQVAFAFGMVIASVYQAVGHVSGGHFNPAVSFGLFAAGDCSFLRAVIYSIVQIVGALCATGLLKLLTNHVIGGIKEDFSIIGDFDPDRSTIGWSLGATELGSGINYSRGILVEVILTFVLVLVVCGATDSHRRDVLGSVPLAIGLCVFLINITGMYYTGASTNPARSIAPLPFTPSALAKKHIIVYILGPLIGGILAGIMYNYLFRAPLPICNTNEGRCCRRRCMPLLGTKTSISPVQR